MNVPTIARQRSATLRDMTRMRTLFRRELKAAQYQAMKDAIPQVYAIITALTGSQFNMEALKDVVDLLAPGVQPNPNGAPLVVPTAMSQARANALVGPPVTPSQVIPTPLTPPTYPGFNPAQTPTFQSMSGTNTATVYMNQWTQSGTGTTLLPPGIGGIGGQYLSANVNPAPHRGKVTPDDVPESGDGGLHRIYTVRSRPIHWKRFDGELIEQVPFVLDLRPDPTMALVLPDKTEIVVGADGNYTISDEHQEVIYKANTIHEFNPFMNASDLVEGFIRECGAAGVTQDKVLHVPIGGFVHWLIRKAAEADGVEQDEAVPEVAQDPLVLKVVNLNDPATAVAQERMFEMVGPATAIGPNPPPVSPPPRQSDGKRFQGGKRWLPRCLHCQRFLSERLWSVGVNFCTAQHMDLFVKAIEAREAAELAQLKAKASAGDKEALMDLGQLAS